MGYIVNLPVILDSIFRTAAGNMTENAALNATGTHVGSGRRDSIHGDIRSFVMEIFGIKFAVPRKDSVLEKIIDSIGQYLPHLIADIGWVVALAIAGFLISYSLYMRFTLYPHLYPMMRN
jgi:hypothetical protein